MRKFVFYVLLALALGVAGMHAGCAGFAPNQAMEHFNQGDVLQNQGKYDEAIAEYNKAIELNKNFANAYSNRGRAYYMKKEYDRAVADYTTAIELDPETVAHYGGRGSAYFNKKQYPLAIQDFNRALELDPQSTVSSTNRDAAISLLTDAEEFNRQGAILADTGKYDEAITFFSKSVAVYPYYTSAYTNRGLVYIVKKEYALAITDFDSAIKLNSEYALAYSGRGLAYIYTERFEEAVADLDKALQIDPEDADTWNNLGVAQEQLGELNAAEESFEVALELDSDNENAKSNLEVLQTGGRPPGVKGWMSSYPPRIEAAWVRTTESEFASIELPGEGEPVGGTGVTLLGGFTGTWVSRVSGKGLIMQSSWPKGANLYPSGIDPEDADWVFYYDVEWEVTESGDTIAGPMTVTFVSKSGRLMRSAPVSPPLASGTYYVTGTVDGIITITSSFLGGLKGAYTPNTMTLASHQPSQFHPSKTVEGVPHPSYWDADVRIRLYLDKVR